MMLLHMSRKRQCGEKSPKVVVGRVCNLFNDILPILNKSLKGKKALDVFLGHHQSTTSETGPSIKRPRRAVPLDNAFVRKALMEGNSSSKP